MTRTTTGWTILVAALGMTLGLLGAEIQALPDYQAATTTAFVGKILVHLSTVIAAFIGGKLIRSE